ncbi:MAG TPA: hypothetical protein DDZ68_15830 [Parvularcula sp.]|nr:hypothetical protein [Parvularcula sp.]
MLRHDPRLLSLIFDFVFPSQIFLENPRQNFINQTVHTLFRTRRIWMRRFIFRSDAAGLQITCISA